MIWSSILLNNTVEKPSLISPLTLAFIGDTVFDLLVREKLVREANRPVGALHSLASARVCAAAQARGAAAVMPVLTAQELEIYKRGRNAHPGGVPKHASSADYHSATGLEALFGWLHLSGNTVRIDELFEIICAHQTKEE